MAMLVAQQRRIAVLEALVARVEHR